LSGSEDFVREKSNFIVYALLNFKSVYRSESNVDMGRLWALTTARTREFWMC